MVSMKRAMELIERSQRQIMGPPNREELMRRRADQERRKAESDALLVEMKAAMEARDWETAMKLSKKIGKVLSSPARPPKAFRPQCTATTRKGTQCKALAIWFKGEWAPRNGKCRNHGGLSTGPITPEGKAAIAESNRRRAEQKGPRP